MQANEPSSPRLTVRELTEPDIDLIADYWAQASDDYLLGMGADPAKLPSREDFVRMLQKQLTLPYAEKPAYAIVWLADGRPVGHCNVNQITYGDKAHMHLHLWQGTMRQRGMGSALVRLSLPFFFENMALQTLICEPYALNPSPNRTLERVGFTFERCYLTVPGYVNFEQEVNRWVLRREDFLTM